MMILFLVVKKTLCHQMNSILSIKIVLFAKFTLTNFNPSGYSRKIFPESFFDRKVLRLLKMALDKLTRLNKGKKIITSYLFY